MFIKKISGYFGIFKGETFNFENGLNVISRNNEWGKTTLIAFIRVMLYGLNTSKRDKKDYLSDKTKYTSHLEFAGEMILNDDNQDIVITRQNNNFNSYYENTGHKTGYTSKDFAQNIIGVSEDVFNNSALIEADNRLISNNEELLSLILAMSTTGDTQSNFKKAHKKLKDKKSEISKPSGMLNQYTKKLENIENEMREVLELSEKLNSYKEREVEKFNSYIEKKQELDTKTREISLKKLEQAERSKIIKAQSDNIIEELKPNFYQDEILNEIKLAYNAFEKSDYAEFTTRTALNNYKLTYENTVLEYETQREEEIMAHSKVTVLKYPFFIAIILAICGFLTVFFPFNIGKFTPYSSVIFFVATLICIALSFRTNKSNININEKYNKLKDELDKNLEDLEKTAQKYIIKSNEDYTKLISLLEKVNVYNLSNKDEINEQINFLLDVNTRYKKAVQFREFIKNDENVDENELILAEEQQIKQIQSEFLIISHTYEALKQEIYKINAKLENLSPINALKKASDTLKQEIEVLTKKLECIDIATDVLTQANDNLTNRLSPEISKKASQYLSFLTENKYNTVVLESDFSALIKNNETFDLLSKLKLSSGTKEQLYFALRLAICDVLLKPNTPIILDDPFVFYDDQRMKKAIDLLFDISKQRQILLFTCQTREIKYVNFKKSIVKN